MVTNTRRVSHLYLIVDLHTIADHRVGKRTPINRRAGTDFNIIANTHRVDLRDLYDRSGDRIELEAKPVRTDNNPAMDQTIITKADAVVHRDIGMQASSIADAGVLTNKDVCAYDDTISERRARFNHRVRGDHDTGAYACISTHDGSGMNTRLRHRCPIKQSSNPSPFESRIVGDEVRQWTIARIFFAKNDGRRL